MNKGNEEMPIDRFILEARLRRDSVLFYDGRATAVK